MNVLIWKSKNAFSTGLTVKDLCFVVILLY
jgi:hypothetical protein